MFSFDRSLGLAPGHSAASVTAAHSGFTTGPASPPEWDFSPSRNRRSLEFCKSSRSADVHVVLHEVVQTTALVQLSVKAGRKKKLDSTKTLKHTENQNPLKL